MDDMMGVKLESPKPEIKEEINNNKKILILTSHPDPD